MKNKKRRKLYREFKFFIYSYIDSCEKRKFYRNLFLCIVQAYKIFNFHLKSIENFEN